MLTWLIVYGLLGQSIPFPGPGMPANTGCSGGPDNFTRANESPITGNWTNNTGNSGNGLVIISSNLAKGNAGDGLQSQAYWNACTATNNQFSQITIDTTDNLSAAARITTTPSTLTLYACTAVGTTDLYIQKYVAGSLTNIVGPTTTSLGNGTVLRIEITGTSIVCKVNGTTISSTTDSDIASGQPGIAFFGITAKASSWSGGNF